MSQGPLTEPEIKVIETIGEMMKFWGFSKHHGRIWALLYLRSQPFASPDIQGLLEMSAGLVSMSLKELVHWDVVTKVWVPGDRKDYYSANTDLWHTITRVLREREYHLLQSSIRSLEDAIGDLETTPDDHPELTSERIDYMKPRIEHLVDVSEAFARFLNLVLNNADANLGQLQQMMLKGPMARTRTKDDD